MAQQTKNAIRRAFIQLLNERPLDKISIKDIAEKGAVNRNTFYYYYADIYALVEDILQLEIQDFQSKLRRYDSWQEAFRDATAFASQNKRAVYHLYNSGNQETLRRYYHKVTLAAMTSYIRDQAEGLKLLYIGRIEPRRDPGFLLRVVEALHKRGTVAKLYVVGDGDDMQTAAFAEQIKAMGLTEDVIWQRKARQQQLGAAYHQADFFLLPTEYEIFGMVLLEAMFFETVALTTPNGGADMLIQDGENGVVLTKDHPEEWAVRMLDLQKQPEKKRRMGAAARETVTQHFTWDALAGTFEQVYEQMRRQRKQ